MPQLSGAQQTAKEALEEHPLNCDHGSPLERPCRHQEDTGVKMNTDSVDDMLNLIICSILHTSFVVSGRDITAATLAEIMSGPPAELTQPLRQMFVLRLRH